MFVRSSWLGCAGMHLYDEDGKQYLDFAAGIAVVALGHSDKQWSDVVRKQAELLCHGSNLFHTRPQLELAQLLAEDSFADRVFFCNTGTEAIEAAIKFARKRGRALDPAGRKTHVLSFTNGFHGRTFGALSATFKRAYQEPFQPLVPNFTVAPFNDTTGLERHIGPDTCAVIVEPVQGEGGIFPASDGFLMRLRELCDQHSALLVFDEIQCGLGRTGYLWAHQATPVVPDILTAAKPLANGLPIGAVLVTNEVSRHIKPGDHGTTFAGGALVCAAAVATYSRIREPAFLRRVRDVGARLHRELIAALSPVCPGYCQCGLLKNQSSAAPPSSINAAVVCVRGRGLICGVQLAGDLSAADVAARCLQKGLLVITAGSNTIRIVPPLIVEPAHVDACVATLADSIRELSAARRVGSA